jgi:solute:Na+ symporter, SSS family
MSHFALIDYLIFVSYGCVIVFVGLWVSRTQKGQQKTTEDYFLASKSLPWWAIGATIIGSNISAEQFIGMSGSGYVIGMGIAIYEWIGALGLIIVAKYFLPIYIEKGIYTMPQFLEKRYDNRIRTSLAVFWLGVYVFVNLTSVLYLGAISLRTVLGVPLIYGIVGLAFFSALYSVYGGLKSVAWTDVIQLVFLVLGGLLTTFLAFSAVAATYGGHGFFEGVKLMYQAAPDKFDLILSRNNPSYKLLPGVSILLGGMWIINLAYFGCNQYITQRALAAKDLEEAQRGMVFAGYLKMLMPLIVVAPGMAAFILTKNALAAHPDEAYPWLLNAFMPVGVKGVAFAALIAAVVAALSSMINSVSTIFTMDIYKQFINKNAGDKQMVQVGRITCIVALVIAIAIAPLLTNLQQAFQYIQEFTGMVTPGIVTIFLLGLFWKRTTSNAALWVALLTIPLSVLFKVVFTAMPFIDQMGIIFLILCGIAIAISLVESKGNHPKAIELNKGLFKTSAVFNIGALGILIIFATLYILFW